MAEIFILKPGEEVVLESKATHFSDKNRIKGYLYLTTDKFLFITGAGKIEFYIPIHSIIAIHSTGFMSRLLNIQYFFDSVRLSQVIFKLKNARHWVTTVHDLVKRKRQSN